MKKTAIAAVVGGVLLAGVVLAEEPAAQGAESKPVKAQTTCPVMGGKINKSQYVDVDGKRIYLCCGGCAGAIKKEPAKYIQKLEADGVTIELAPVSTQAVKEVTAPVKAQ